ncbi:hypothetical protein HPP92_015394 [Vanilla planifolia]|uniref:Uncharacterized protein n=1 Tax=Vanilla planifolia TaxID=51239 RepID=A0A835QQ15_VANPL|nr:hypothetical protein HPP92_015967 [Vanilla planifolia]KAG0475708.1 hypothetical protein HPP92_015394 [Vanilla planifolia]
MESRQRKKQSLQALPLPTVSNRLTHRLPRGSERQSGPPPSKALTTSIIASTAAARLGPSGAFEARYPEINQSLSVLSHFPPKTDLRRRRQKFGLLPRHRDGGVNDTSNDPEGDRVQQLKRKEQMMVSMRTDTIQGGLKVNWNRTESRRSRMTEGGLSASVCGGRRSSARLSPEHTAVFAFSFLARSTCGQWARV